MVAAALLDGDVGPAQYEPERIRGDDVQDLLRRVRVRPADDLSRRFPEEHACRLRVRLRDGRALERDKRDYEGFHTRPAAWDTLVSKFERLAQAHAGAALRREIVEAVERLEERPVRELAALLARVPFERGAGKGEPA